MYDIVGIVPMRGLRGKNGRYFPILSFSRGLEVARERESSCCTLVKPPIFG